MPAVTNSLNESDRDNTEVHTDMWGCLASPEDSTEPEGCYQTSEFLLLGFRCALGLLTPLSACSLWECLFLNYPSHLCALEQDNLTASSWRGNLLHMDKPFFEGGGGEKVSLYSQAGPEPLILLL